MDNLNSDLIFHVAQYVSVLDAANWMQASRRHYYLIHKLRSVLGPEMVVAAASTPVLAALGQLRQKPTLALCNNTARSTFNETIASRLPSSTVVLGAISNSIQTCWDGKVECTSEANILLGNLGKDATVQPFLWNAQGRHGLDWETMEQQVRDCLPASSHYEVFFVYGCGHGCGVLEEFVECVQSLHPRAALVGGICGGGYVSKMVQIEELDKGVLSSKRVAVLKQMFKDLGGPTSTLETLTEKQTLVDCVHSLLRKSPYILEPDLENAVFGVALGGNVPIRSVVSRGVKRLTPPDTHLIVEQARLLGPTLGHDWQQQQTRTLTPAFHVLDSIFDKDNEKEFNLMSFLAHANSSGNGVDFCGIRRRIDDDKYEDSFELYALDLHADKIKIPCDNPDLFGRAMSMSHTTPNEVKNTHEREHEMDAAQVDFFALDGKACVEHVESTMKQLKKYTDDKQEHVMAAMMYSCGGRGPYPGWLINKPMADASAFFNAFGREVSCIGFYAGGEIGPLAKAPAADATERNLFQRGKAALQGFTAVFALFIAPKVDLRQIEIDDSPGRVSEFIADQLTSGMQA